MAHEIGHILGMKHDPEDCICEAGSNKCIMTERVSSNTKLYWSTCSKNDIKDHLENSIPLCLKNKPKTLLKRSICGNGFLEAGEECDCGMPAFCHSKCCDAKTCKLFNNATCATGECCNQKSCKIKKAGTLCRKIESDCDLPEFCTGLNEHCPKDLRKSDAVPCKNDAGYCYKGSCETKDELCRSYWGLDSFSLSNCYHNNELGNEFGNCGFDNKINEFIKCADEDRECGILQCQRFKIKNREDYEPMGITNDGCAVVFEDHYLENTYSHPVYVKNGLK
jgi:hypothetical protein